MLENYKRILEHSAQSNIDISEIKRYQELVNIVKALGDIISIPGFILTAIFFCLLLSNLLVILIITNMKRDFPVTLLGCCFTLLQILVTFTYLIWTCSDVSNQMKSIKRIFEHLYETEIFADVINRKRLLLLKKMSEKEIVYFSGYDIFLFNSKFVVEFLSAILTYSLLI